MLILIGIFPAQYALNPKVEGAKISELTSDLEWLKETTLLKAVGGGIEPLRELLAEIRTGFSGRTEINSISTLDRSALRADILRANDELGAFEQRIGTYSSKTETALIKQTREDLRGAVDFVVPGSP